MADNGDSPKKVEEIGLNETKNNIDSIEPVAAENNSKHGRKVANNQKIQSLNYFPHNPKKHIDYVIHYKEERHDSRQVKEIRRRFFKILENEGFTTHKITVDRNKSDKSKSVYVFLNCDIKRLMEEAERIHLQLPLKNCDILNEYKGFLNCACFQRIKRLFKRPLKRDEYDFVSAPFETDVKFIFKNFDTDAETSRGFTNTIRYLLVDHILTNLNIDLSSKQSDTSNNSTSLREELTRKLVENINSEQITMRNLLAVQRQALNENDDRESQSSTNGNIEEKTMISKKLTAMTGLPYMLEKKYFSDAFVLHDETCNTKKNNELMVNLIKSNETLADLIEESDVNRVNKTTDTKKRRKDKRSKLNDLWAKFSNLLKFQPMWKIRNYFGEYIALYFAWCGTLISTLWVPSILGLIFFLVGLITSVKFEQLQISKNQTFTETISYYGNVYLNVFADSFDNSLTPYFAVIICIWGAFFSEYWKRENSRLAYEWDTEDFEKMEGDRIQYTNKLQSYNKKFGTTEVHYPEYKKYLKYFVTYAILVLMILFVILETSLIILYRIHIKKKVFPDKKDSTLNVIVGDFGSTIINIIVIMIMNRIYAYVAVKLTDWENPRTKTEYDDALILKLFAFEFVNSYGSLFYIAFFRQITFPNGLFNLGPEYQDECDKNNCMALLTIQVFVVLLIKPFPRFFSTVILPFIVSKYKKCLLKRHLKKSSKGEKNTNDSGKQTFKGLTEPEISLFLYASLERKKPDFKDNIREEYIEKCIMYGYIMLFASSFSLGPLFFLIANLFDIRVDAKRIVWMYRRPVAYQAQDTGMFYYITQFLNVCGIISNGFIIAYTSNWSVGELGKDDGKRLMFVAIFEHVIFFLWILIYLWPDTSNEVQFKMRQESKYSQEIVLAARALTYNTHSKQNHKNLITNAIFHKENHVPLKETNNDDEETNIDNQNTESQQEISSTVNEIEDNSDTSITRKRKSKKLLRTQSQIHPI